MSSTSHESGLDTKASLSGFLELLGFREVPDGTFTNGRATVRFEGTTLVAIAAGGAPTWRTDLAGASEVALRYLLGQVLASPGFLSQMEIERQSARQLAAREALLQLAAALHVNPEGHSGAEIRSFLWSLYNGHHRQNLWRLKSVLDSEQSAAVVVVFVAWMEGFVPEKNLREALLAAGEPAL